MSSAKRDRLAERIAIERARDPEAFARELGFADRVVQCGWAVIYVVDEPFAFSVGMNYLHDQPEVMIIADDLAPRQFMQLINEVCCHVRDRGPIELGTDYTETLLLQCELAIETDPRDEARPPEERRVLASEGERLMLVDVHRPLVFKDYTDAIEEEFPCGYLSRFNRVLCELGDIAVIVADLRRLPPSRLQ